MFTGQTFAVLPDCSQKTVQRFDGLVCKDKNLSSLNDVIKAKYLSAQLMSNAPLKLLKTTQIGWQHYVQECKTTRCIQQQFEQRINDLDLFTSMNQSLTQYFIRQNIEQRHTPLTQLQLHQLDKNRIKIEGIQYRNPNNAENTRVRYLRSYTSPDQFSQVIDLETKCKYSLERQGHLLKFSSKDGSCRYFTGIYKLFD
ncbi:hypothetical protein F4V57_01265 [Acinetobacter qingfengensis]|uniref:DUF1311 domain-containing protein n=1 Tax=Acinetobacter qingfengensis TaxID=1262585 RepID=A0A1E7R9A1_9GAMM|nr:hypothetical protein [Acinetobacter qingfengensis]KAA8735459.1 hypothetical protein F4V57_01265 [Acinetobacter qingfengensis]OEY95896.1 hypothetical protein BJI46_02985 [Acinetobacter qingfengensis]